MTNYFFKNLIIILTVCALTQGAFAQTDEKNNEMKKKVTGHFFVSAGVNWIYDYQINPKLEQMNLPKINPAHIYSSFGIDVNYSNFDFGVNFGIINSVNKSDICKTASMGLAGSLDIRYRILKIDDFYINTGGRFSVVPTTLKLNSTTQSPINFDSINPGSHYGNIELYNTFMTAGVVIGICLFTESSFPFEVDITYDWGLTKPQWRSEYGNTMNSPNEKANRLGIVVKIPFNTL